jgi:hypothetical protein
MNINTAGLLAEYGLKILWRAAWRQKLKEVL